MGDHDPLEGRISKKRMFPDRPNALFYNDVISLSSVLWKRMGKDLVLKFSNDFRLVQLEK